MSAPSDIEGIELNEAFAAIVIAVLREHGLSPGVINFEGGNIAHGHPVGTTGTVLTTRLIHSTRRDGLGRGIGGGQGIALAIVTIGSGLTRSGQIELSGKRALPNNACC